MSYAMRLDEYSKDELEDELKRRKRLTVRGLCDYCERSPETPPCKFPSRHGRRIGKPNLYPDKDDKEANFWGRNPCNEITLPGPEQMNGWADQFGGSDYP